MVKKRNFERGGLPTKEVAVKKGTKATREQRQAMDLFADCESFAVQAGAGTGKTSTLLFMAEQDMGWAKDTSGAIRRGQYVAFNKSIVQEAGRKFPSTVASNTAHSLAFRAVGKHYRHRLNAKRMRSSELATRLRLKGFEFNIGGHTKHLQPAYLASLVMRTVDRFCQTADDEPRHRHFPYIDGIDMPEEDGTRTYEHNDWVREQLLPVVEQAWSDLMSTAGQLPFKHGHYLKAWQLDDPRIEADYILFDECQDADPVMTDIVERQEAQIVLVGDSQQEIYGWRGAVNAFDLFGMEHTTYLTQSFRFGDDIAAVANLILEGLPTPLRLKGHAPLRSRVGAVAHPDAILTRTNANAVRAVLELLKAQVPVCLVGGGKDVLAFARAANDLMMRGHTMHPELACFENWDEVREYVDQDPQGGDLKLLFDLVEEFGVETIEQALGDTQKEEPGVTVVSTAHKAKGREWDKVQLGADFAPKRNKKTGEEQPPKDEEKRLLYVAVTRAKEELDVTRVPQLDGLY